MRPSSLRARAAALTLAAVAAASAAPAGARTVATGSPPSATGSPPSATGSRANAAARGAASPVIPVSVTAHRLRGARHGTLGRGALLSQRSLGTRTFVTSARGFALASVQGVTYPAQTVDRGRTWRVDGPEFHLPAAQGPLVVTQSGAHGRTYFAWGGPEGGNAVDATRDAGKTWWRALFSGVILSVTPARHRLIAVVQYPSSVGTSALDMVYVSRDGGRHWKADERLGAM